MRIDCPLCGMRDLREFSYLGDARLAARPAPDAPAELWHDHVHLRDNPAGPHEELWQHALGCRAWLRVRRDTLTHAIASVERAR